MPRVVVDVMPKPEILDPQGQAVHRALARLGFDEAADVRQGKRFEIVVADTSPQTLDQLDHVAATLLSNPVIEDYTVHVQTEQ